ncbi:MAG: ROK family protein [Lachnospiraceae bacterium]|nr:ROK family protein [Lachnospiraceae bacterium]
MRKENGMRIGIDLGGTFIKGGIVNDANEIVVKKAVPTEVKKGPAGVIENMLGLVGALLDEMQGGAASLQGIGIGSPGTVDDHTGRVLYSNNFNWENVDLAGAFTQRFGCAVKVSNDANCAALGEMLSDKEKSGSAVLLTLGTGVGSGIISGGKLYPGDNPGGAELGHMVIRSGGRLCSCGRRGCLESYASATALIESAREAAALYPDSELAILADKNDLNGKTITDAVRKGDSGAITVFDAYLDALGEGIVNVINIFRPDVIYLGGGVCESFDLMEDKLNAFAEKYAFGGDKALVARIKKASGGNDAGIIGAAGLLL